LNKDVQTWKAKAPTFEIFSVQDQRGLARWQSPFTVIQSGKRLATDCLFVVWFDEEELCQTFREWWRIQEI
jgi:hypothetical protein